MPTGFPVEVKIGDATRVLSGGAREVAAGGGYPLRVTTAAMVTIAAGGNIYYNGPCWDNDGLHVWLISSSNLKILRKFLVSTGTEVVAARVTFDKDIYSVQRVGDDTLIVGGADTVYEVTASTSTVTATISLAAGADAYRAIRVPGVVGKYWVQTTAATAGSSIVEYGSDGSATGRTIADAQYCGMITHPDVAGYLWVWTQGSVAKKIRESDLAVITTYTPNAAGFGGVGEVRNPNPGWVDTAGRLYTRMATVVDRWTAAGAVDCRILWCDAVRQVPAIALDVAANPCPFVAFTDDDQWMAWPAAVTGATIRYNAIRAQCVGTQRARYSVTWDHDVSISSIVVPGLLGRTQDATSDYRATRCYYSFDGGATRTEFVPGDVFAAPIAVSAGARTITIDIDFCLLGLPPMADPYVGDADGNAFVLEGTDPSAATYPTSGLPTSATTLTAIRTNYTTALEALTPTLQPGYKFHRSQAAATGSSASLRQFRWDSEVGSDDLGVCDYSCRLVREHLKLTVTYPGRLPGIYPALDKGDDDDAAEAMIRSDVDKLSDALRTAVNYVSAMLQCEPEFEIERSEDGSLWTLTVDCAIDYYRAQTVL